MSNLKKSIRKANKAKGKQFPLIVILLLLFLGSWAFISGSGERMAVFEAQSAAWVGEVSLSGFVENGDVYKSISGLPSTAVTTTWTDDEISVDIDGSLRMHGSSALLGPEINTDLPYPNEYNNMDQYPSAKPNTAWSIVDNIMHVGVDGNYLSSGVPSIVTQENGLLVEIYYYTFGLQLDLTAARSVDHNFYSVSFNSLVFGTQYMYEVSPIRGLYALPEIALTPMNESITDLGSDLATYGSTMFKFYEVGTNTEVSLSTMIDTLGNLNKDAMAFNRDFFMAGGDSGAGLNIYNKVDENTNQFAVGFVKVGLPCYVNLDLFQLVLNNADVYIWDVKLLIPLRISVIITYELPYDNPVDVYNYGNDNDTSPDTDSLEYWFSQGEDVWDDALLKGSEKFGISIEMLGMGIIILMVVLVVYMRRS